MTKNGAWLDSLDNDNWRTIISQHFPGKASIAFGSNCASIRCTAARNPRRSLRTVVSVEHYMKPRPLAVKTEDKTDRQQNKPTTCGEDYSSRNLEWPEKHPTAAEV